MEAATINAEPRTDAGQQRRPPKRPTVCLGEGVKRFHALLDELIALNKQNRVMRDGLWKHHGAADYAITEATIQANIGRQTGKTEYILRSAQPTDLIIVPHRQMMEHPQYRDAPCTVVSAETLRYNYNSRARAFSSMRYATIWIDEPEEVFKRIDRREMYFQLARDTAQTFILLG